MRDRYLLAALPSVPPDNARLLVERLGYSRILERSGIGDVYSSDAGHQVIVPRESYYADYAHSLLALLKALQANEQPRTIEDWFSLLVFPDTVFLQYAIGDPVAEGASLPLHYLVGSTNALYDFVRYTAAGVCSGQSFYTRLPEPAAQLAHECRLGQTQPGSFILRLLLPQKPTNLTALDTVTAEPFGRQVLQACMDNLEFIHATPKLVGDAEVLPPTMGPQVAEAVARLRPPSDFASTRADSDFVTKSGEIPQPRQAVELSPFSFSRAEEIVVRLKRALQYEEEVLKGFIVDLHKDRPSESDTEISRSVTLDVKYGGRWRKLTLALLPAQFQSALEWVEQDRELLIRAVIDKNTTPWTVYNLREFRPIDDRQERLF